MVLFYYRLFRVSMFLRQRAEIGHSKIQREIANTVNGIWGSGNKPMCRVPNVGGTADGTLE